MFAGRQDRERGVSLVGTLLAGGLSACCLSEGVYLPVCVCSVSSLWIYQGTFLVFGVAGTLLA